MPFLRHVAYATLIRMDESGDGALVCEAAKQLFGDDWVRALCRHLAMWPGRPQTGFGVDEILSWSDGCSGRDDCRPHPGRQ